MRFFVFFIFAVISWSFAEPKTFDSLEFISSEKFQNKVIRHDRVKRICEDSTIAPNLHDFACAAYLYYDEKWDAAYQAYDSLQGKDSLLDRSILIRMARTRLYDGELKEVNKTLDLGKRMEKDPEWQQQASRIRMETYLAYEDQPQKKADSLESFLKKYPQGPESDEFRYRRAVLLENVKKWDLAQKAYLRVLSDYSDFGDSAFIAIRRIRKTHPSDESIEEKITYANRICFKGINKECLNLIDSIFILDSLKAPPRDTTKIPKMKTAEDSTVWRLAPSTLDLKTRIKLWEKRATALRREKENVAAINAYRFLLDSVEIRARWMQSLLRLLRTEKKKEEANTIDSLFQIRFKYSPENANNIWVRGFEFEQNKRYENAIATYNELASSDFQNTNKHEWAKFRIGFVYFKQGLYPEAEKAFIDARNEPFTWSSNASRMFLAETYLKQGKNELARDAYLDCIRDFPLSYYAARSRTKLARFKLLDSAQIPFLSPQILSDDSTLAWIRSYQPSTKREKSYTPEIFYRVKHLLESGFTEEAYDLYVEESKNNYNHLDFLYEYGRLFLDAGEVTKGYKLARKFQNLIDRKSMGTAPRNVLRFIYPVPYARQVVVNSGSGINPFFVYSVMRQESSFNYHVSSCAGARGLLQIMPPTGAKLAKRESLDTFIPSMLFNPYMNIRLGIRYLKDLLVEYNQDPMYVLCNYNAGPKPTKRWVQSGKGLDWDLRVEEISYWETRDYVKRVLGNYWVYEEIWNGIPQ